MTMRPDYLAGERWVRGLQLNQDIALSPAAPAAWSISEFGCPRVLRA
jgi:hypothetical protein